MGITAVAVDRTTDTSPRRCVDVTDVATDRVQGYAADAPGEAHLERRGGRTFLVVDA
jgi:hypothetical protein